MSCAVTKVADVLDAFITTNASRVTTYFKRAVDLLATGWADGRRLVSVESVAPMGRGRRFGRAIVF